MHNQRLQVDLDGILRVLHRLSFGIAIDVQPFEGGHVCVVGIAIAFDYQADRQTKWGFG
ncbi:MAG: hypothetical protein WA655_16655 [Candidatus Korobacteraceae bacterium]